MPRFWRGFRCTDRDVASIRASISRGIIARAIGEGRTIETPSARLDARFSDLGSVRQNAIQAVLCAPVGVPATDRRDLSAGSHASRARSRRRIASAPSCSRASSRRSPTDSGSPRVDHDRIDYTREVRERLRCPEIIGRSQGVGAAPAICVARGTAGRRRADHRSVGDRQVDARARDPTEQPARVGPFVELNCAAIPEALIENELFGAERGAHSTATRKVTGKVAAAEGGTLFLDEIGELTAGAQAKLLQLLETREYHSLGSTTSIRADVRILSATNANLEERVAGQAVPRGPLLPDARRAARGARARRAPRRHPRAGRALLRRVVQAPPAAAARGVAPRARGVPRGARGPATPASSRTRSRPR